jgi:hypothetical protein
MSFRRFDLVAHEQGGSSPNLGSRWFRIHPTLNPPYLLLTPAKLYLYDLLNPPCPGRIRELGGGSPCSHFQRLQIQVLSSSSCLIEYLIRLFLVDPGDGVLPHEATSAVLKELASKTGDIAAFATLAYRVIEVRALWKDHPDPSVRSAEDLIRKLGSGIFGLIKSNGFLFYERSLIHSPFTYGVPIV